MDDTSNDEKIARLASHEGWAVLSLHIRQWLDSAARSYDSKSFENLLEVGRIQGERKSLQRVLDFVQRRADKALKGD